METGAGGRTEQRPSPTHCALQQRKPNPNLICSSVLALVAFNSDVFASMRCSTSTLFSLTLLICSVGMRFALSKPFIPLVCCSIWSSRILIVFALFPSSAFLVRRCMMSGEHSIFETALVKVYKNVGKTAFDAYHHGRE